MQLTSTSTAVERPLKPIYTGLLNRCAVLRGWRLDRHTDETKAGLAPSVRPVRAIPQVPEEQPANKMAGSIGSRRESPRGPSALTERQATRGRSAHLSTRRLISAPARASTSAKNVMNRSVAEAGSCYHDLQGRGWYLSRGHLGNLRLTCFASRVGRCELSVRFRTGSWGAPDDGPRTIAGRPCCPYRSRPRSPRLALRCCRTAQRARGPMGLGGSPPAYVRACS